VPHALLQIGAADVQRQRERPERRRDVPADFRERGFAALFVANQVRFGKSRAEVADQARLRVPHHDRDDAALADGHQQRPERAPARGVADSLWFTSG